MPQRMSAITAVLATAAVIGATAGPAAAASSPTVTTGVATNQTQSSALLRGTINPNGAATTYYFQWGPTNAFGSASMPATLAAGSKSLTVRATAAGLTPGTTYYYRLVASNSSGEGVGATRTFRTQGNPPPGASTGGAESVNRHGATLTGVVYPNNGTTTYFFQYGLSATYTAQTLPLTVSGSAPASVSATLYGLEPGTVFHYRLVVEHTSATTESAGQDQVFETLPSPRPHPGVSASTSPRRGRVPITLTTSGRVHDPRWILAGLGCTGQARVTVSLGRRTLRSTRVAVQPGCTFAATESFRKLPGHGPRGRRVRLVVRVRFLGNPYLAPSSARNQAVTLH